MNARSEARRRHTEPHNEEQQRKILAFLVAYIDEHVWAPSYAEIREGTGIGSSSTVHAHLNALEARGMVRLGHAASPSTGSRMIALTKEGRKHGRMV